MSEVKLWAHQEEALRRCYGEKEYAFLFEMGTGKTLTCIQALRDAYQIEGGLFSTLILAPVIVLKNWKDEWLQFSSVNKKRILVLSGPTKKRLQMLEEAWTKYGRNIIAITNYEGLVASPDFSTAIYQWKPRGLVIDESQRIKSHSSKRTKIVTKIADRAEYKYLLTGTPILNSPLDIFSQYRALDGGKTFGKSFFAFRAHYFWDKNANMPRHVHFPNWQIRPTSYDEMNEKIYAKAMRVEKKDCLDLPPLVKTKIEVDMAPKQARMYREMEHLFVTELADSQVTADLAITKTLRMLQIINGFVKDDEGKERSIDSPKAKALKELLQDITPHSKVIVWACFKQNYEQIRKICNDCKIQYVEAHGGISNKRKYAAVDSFNNQDDTRVFIGHPASLGVGINLVAASYSIYFSRTHNLEHDTQSEARNYRGGSEVHDRITRYDLVTRGTIDEAVLEALERKVTDAEKILSLIKNSIDSKK